MKDDKPDKHEITRDDKGRWKNGVSGNPKGRPKGMTMTELIKDIGDVELQYFTFDEICIITEEYNEYISH